MSSNTKIEWTDETWNPLVGCTKVSPGCANCYAERMAARLKAMALADIAAGRDPGRKRMYIDAVDDRGRWTGKMGLDVTAADEPYSWLKPRRVFVNSMSDLFHEGVPSWFIDHLLVTMVCSKRHTFQILTKRADRLDSYLLDRKLRNRVTQGVMKQIGAVTAGDGLKHWPPKNILWGVSIENRQQLERLNPLRSIGSAGWLTMISAEPLLEVTDLRLRFWSGPKDHGRTRWVIVGGESGPNARPMLPEAAKLIRRDCECAEVPFFFKQWGEFHTNSYNTETKQPVFRQFTSLQH